MKNLPFRTTTDFAGNVSVFGWFCICSTALFFSWLGIVDPVGYRILIREDAWVENLTAIGLFLAGLLLFATAWMERSFARRCVYILGGLAMVFGAGEEISWGQRIFGFATPGFLLDVNNQKEFNVHNTDIGQDIFKFIAPVTLFSCIVSLSAFFCRKDKLFGIPLSSIFLILCFLVVHSWIPLPTVSFSIRNPFMFKNAIMLFPILIIFLFFSGKRILCITSVATLMFVLAHAYTYWNSQFHPEPYTHEVFEFLFGLICFFYAFELFFAHGCRVAWFGTPFHGGKESGGRVGFGNSSRMNVRLSMIKGGCALIVAGSIGLSVLGYFGPDRAAAVVEEGYSRIKVAEPIIRSVFDVYLIENQLIYFKAPCVPSDNPIRHRFFLHVIPTDTNALTKNRRPFGFEGYLFYNSFFWYDVMHAGGRCMAIIPLPDYDVAGIRTGMKGSLHGRVWEGRWDG